MQVSDHLLTSIPPSFAGRIGVARREITPPVGIYSRMWGAAEHDIAEGIHRPLLATVLTVRQDLNEAPLVLATLDLCYWANREDEWFVRGGVLKSLGLHESRLMLSLSHTHSAPSICRADREKPGGELIEPYLVQIRDTIVAAVQEALISEASATLSWATGRCSLAAHRDLADPDGGDCLCGFNPNIVADDTVVVGRVSSGEGEVLATLVNYACHPTTLGPANRFISPDFIGALRDTVESATGSAPCMFLQGASGELAPRRQYLAEHAIADQHGRQLAYAVLSALTGLPSHNRGLALHQKVESGARLGIWDESDFPPSQKIAAKTTECTLTLKPTAQQSQGSMLQQSHVGAERQQRAQRLRQQFGDATQIALPIWGWRLGDALIVGCPAEAYSPLQQKLRSQCPDRAIVAMNLVNGYYGYLPTSSAFEMSSYAAQVSLFQPDCLEHVACAAKKLMLELLADS